MGNGRTADHIGRLRRIARIWSALAAGMILVIFAGDAFVDGLGPVLKLTTRETLMMVALACLWLGLVLGWLRELAGGLLTIGSALAFYLFDFAFSGTFPRGPFFLLFAAPGLLYIYCALQTRKSGSFEGN